MQTKLIEILSVASAWMTAAEIADKGGWRSPANVGVALQQMEKANGNVERRKSATKKQGNAHAVAMSAARQHGFAEVFALVPVGKAVRGAEWKSAK